MGKDGGDIKRGVMAMIYKTFVHLISEYIMFERVQV